MKKTIIPVIITAAITSLLTIWGVTQLTDKQIILQSREEAKVPVHYVSNTGIAATQPVDFSPAAESSVQSVVHVRTLTQGKTVVAQDPFGFWGPQRYQMPDQMGSGSGVIISKDGYIITNNHVVQGADQVQVTFNDRSTELAKVVGTDPSTDIAVLKINGDDLPYMTLGNSDNVKLGQWVLAVGYPLNLEATVTAGIVSAKSRSIGLSARRVSAGAVESFIQTDAAVNPGNSGGALVNTQGQLIGINAAIASPTGSYAGYSYAIPSNLAYKVASDIIKYGSVQRGYLGAQLLDLNKLNEQMAEQIGLSSGDFRNAKGVFIAKVMPGSGAEVAGLRKGDFVTTINGVAVNRVTELMEQVARFHPGDKISVEYMRSGKSRNVLVELKDLSGTTNISKGGTTMAFSGATLRNISKEEAGKWGVKGGVVVADVSDGSLVSRSNIRKGFVIISANDIKVNDINDFQTIIAQSSGGIQLGGIYPGRRGIYYYGIDDDTENW